MNKLPAEYQWLLKVGTLPKMVEEAIQFIGTREIPGPKHNSIILGWADRVGIGKLVNDDEQPWCGLFMAYIATICGKAVPMKDWDMLRALQWVNFGSHVVTPVLGDVLIFRRDGGGHVGLYIAETKTHYAVLGGNQNNSVSIALMDKQRLHTAVRPPYNKMPESVKQYFIDAKGTPISTSEA